MATVHHPERKSVGKRGVRSAGPLGFTLAELIVVITILAILATVGILTLSDYLSSSRDSSRITEIGQISRSVELSAVQNGKYPMPVASETSPLVSFTGWAAWTVIVTQWAATSVNVRDLGGSFGKKKATGPFIYSVLWDGFSYQVASEFENALGFSAGFADLAHAASKTAYVAGTYRPDPSLPSLVTSSGSVGASGLFSPDVCFVINGGQNLFTSSSGCVPKKSLELKAVDAGLAAYWDMETVCSAWTCGAWNDGKLADLSGNGNHGTWSGGIIAGGVPGSAGKWTLFSSGSKQYFDVQDSGSLDVSEKFTITFVVRSDETNPAGDMDVLSKFRGTVAGVQEPYRFGVWYQLATAWSATTGFVDNGAHYPRNVQQPVPMYEHVYAAFTNTGNYDPYVYERNIYRESVKFTNEPARFVAVSFDNGEVRTYVNGIKLRQSKISWNLPFVSDGKVVIWSRVWTSNYMNGLVDEVKMYSRTLSDSEILQQAKALWY